MKEIFLAMVLSEYNNSTLAQEAFKQRVMDDWQKTFNMPRKNEKETQKRIID